jgi:DNA-binding CsgD family transcriptional regulator
MASRVNSTGAWKGPTVRPGNAGRRPRPEYIRVLDAPAPHLFGRERELGVLNGLTARLSEGAGGALVVRGEAGIGKSAMLAAVAAGARERGIRLLSSVGIQTEAHLLFAGLHQLVEPVLHLAEGLPPRQRAALVAAVGMSGRPAPGLFLIGLATLELVSESAESSSVLVIVDDAQWLDKPSCAVLAFVARRLAAESAVMLIALRDGQPSPFDDAGLAELRLEGLSEDAAGALLDARAPGLEPVVRQRLLQEAAGNPLALVELPTAVRSERLGRKAPLPLTTRLEQAFAARASGLPADTRSVLLAAATDDGSVLGEVLKAAGMLTGAIVTADAVAPAVAARLVEIDGSRLRFRHPLVRSAIYQAASLSQRQAAHAALSEVLTDQPDRRVWHRAAATLGPDEQVATELDMAAGRAERRGAVELAITALSRGAELSAGSASRGRRLLRAAEQAFDFGLPELGSQLLRTAEPLDLPAEERTWLSWLHEAYTDDSWSGAAKIGFFVEMADRMRAGGHADLAVRSLLAIALRYWWGNPSPQIRAAVVAAAERIPLPEDEPALLAVLAHADPVQRGALVIDRISRISPDATDPAGMYLIAAAASAVWAFDLSLGFLDAAVSGLRAQGRLGLLARALVSQAWAAIHLARQPVAVAAAEEARRLAQETKQLRWAIAAQLAQATIAAERGDVDAAEALTCEAEAVLLPMGATPMLSLAQFARGHGAVAHERYAEGFRHLRRVFDPADPAYQPLVGTWGLCDLVEAAAHTGRTDTAVTYLRQLESLAAATSGPLLRAEVAYARPLVAADGEAEALYEAALQDGLTSWPGHRNRMLLWYGTWLRRQRRVGESRVPLRAARDGFDALALANLAERARQELRASGEASRRRIPDAWDQLTPQELLIARMAAEGLSNREIGQRLFISHRTVGYHLYQLFPKLGIGSRSQLHAALASLSDG